MGRKPTGNKASTAKGLCKAAVRQTLIRCSCPRSTSLGERECVRRMGAPHVLRLIAPGSSMKTPAFGLSIHHRLPPPFFGRGKREGKEKPWWVLGTEVFLLRVVPASIVSLQSLTTVEMVYVLSFPPRGRLSCANPLLRTTTSALPFQGWVKPPESAWRQPQKDLKHVGLCDFPSVFRLYSRYLGPPILNPATSLNTPHPSKKKKTSKKPPWCMCVFVTEACG